MSERDLPQPGYAEVCRDCKLKNPEGGCFLSEKMAQFLVLYDEADRITGGADLRILLSEPQERALQEQELIGEAVELRISIVEKILNNFPFFWRQLTSRGPRDCVYNSQKRPDCLALGKLVDGSKGSHVQVIFQAIRNEMFSRLTQLSEEEE